jgi:N-methylhydantoinase A
MGYVVNVDVGGTFTDFYVGKDGRSISTKTPTTHYDLSVGFLRGLEECASKEGITLEDFLKDTEVIKYCTTLGTNALIERSGPRLGLITTRGFEDTIFIGRGRQWADGLPLADIQDITNIDKPVPLIPRRLVVGINERIDYKGAIITPLKKEEVLDKIGYLVDNGVRGFVVSLLWSFINPIHERQIKDIIEEVFPEVYLGNMPVILSSDISPKEGEYTRTMTAVVNAYMHQGFAEQMSSLCAELMDKGYTKPIMMVDNLGGCSKLSRTKVARTHGGGPVSGLSGAATLCRQIGMPNVAFTDVGGTSYDVGVVAEGAVSYYDLYPTIGRWRTQLTTMQVTSIGAGGGSIAWINPLLGNRMEVGPRSAGSIPGPACYDLGGEEPTVSDADCVLGYLNPDYFNGGKMSLNKEKALAAMRKISDKLTWDEVTTALMIKRVIDAKMGQEVFKEIALKGYEPSEFIYMACGGAGPTHCCGIASRGEMKNIIIPPSASVSGAYGAYTLDILHTYEKSRHIRMYDYATGTFLTDYDFFNSAVKELQEQATKDIVLEGFTDKDAVYKLELEMRYGRQWRYTSVESPLLMVKSEKDVRKVCDRFTEEFSKLYGAEAAYPEGGIEAETLRLMVTMKLPHTPPVKFPLGAAAPPKDSYKGQREAFWEKFNAFRPTDIYQWELLRPGNQIAGPAIIEAEGTTAVIEPGWVFKVDEYLNGLVTMKIKE